MLQNATVDSSSSNNSKGVRIYKFRAPSHDVYGMLYDSLIFTTIVDQ